LSVTALGVDEVDSHCRQEFGKARDHITSRIGNGEVRATRHFRKGLETWIGEHLLHEGAIASGDEVTDGEAGDDDLLHVRRRRFDEFIGLLLAPPRESLLRPAASGGSSLHMPTASVARLDMTVLDDGRREAASAYKDHRAARRASHVIDETSGGIDVINSEGRS